MGFFSEIASEARRGTVTPTHQTAAPPAAPKPAPTPPVTAPEAPAVQPATTPPVPTEATTPPQTPPQAGPAPSAHTPPPPEVRLTVEDAVQAPDDTAARKAHEAAEAKRKAEWDAKQAEKRAKRQAELDRIAAMDSDELLSAAVGRVAADTEKLTRRNMKEAVAEHISAKCQQDTAFAMLVMDPDKSMIHCFQYINRMAKDYIEKAIKAETPNPESGIYGDDVPDDLVYLWAEDYYNDQNAKEDRKNEEKFAPKLYVPATRQKASGKSSKSKPEKKKPAAERPKDMAGSLEQLSLI